MTYISHTKKNKHESNKKDFFFRMNLMMHLCSRHDAARRQTTNVPTDYTRYQQDWLVHIQQQLPQFPAVLANIVRDFLVLSQPEYLAGCGTLYSSSELSHSPFPCWSRIHCCLWWERGRWELAVKHKRELTCIAQRPIGVVLAPATLGDKLDQLLCSTCEMGGKR